MLNNLKPIIHFCLAFFFCLSIRLLNASDNFVLASDKIDRSTPSQARQLLQEGIELYEQGAFASAGELWLKSADLATQQSDILGEALALNNLSLAQQQLGKWQESQSISEQSLKLLQKSKIAAQKPGYWSILAKIYNTQGNWQLQAGQAQSALASWRNAAQYYAQINNQSGVIKTQINQAKALQALGSTVQAVDILNQVNDNMQQELGSPLRATSLRYLAIGLKNLGKLEAAADALRQSIAIAQPQAVSLAWLELGNIYRKQSDRAQTVGKETQAQEYYEEAIQAYTTAAESDSQFLPAKLNQLSLWVETGRNSEAEAFLREFSFPEAAEPSRNYIYAQLNYARSLTCLRLSEVVCQRGLIKTAIAPNYGGDPTEIIRLLQLGIANAHTLQDPIAEAQALEQLAEVFEVEGSYETVLELNQKALLLLEEKSAPDIVYPLEWQLGRIYQQQGNLVAATAAYSEAIASLEQVRNNLLLIDPQVQFSFRDRVEPVYREYAELILTTIDDQPPSQDKLRAAIKIVDALQVAELENFLGCNLSQLFKLDETTVDPTAAQIYPIILEDRLVTIIEIPEQPFIYREVKVGRSQVTKTLQTLQNNLTQPGKTPEVLKDGQQVYQWLIAPLESLLVTNPQIKTLVLIPDSSLRNVPFGALYDGEKYLIEKDYAFAISPRLELFAPAPSVEPLKILTGGVELAQTIEGIKFPPIAQVEQELAQIAQEVSTNTPLLNDAFTEQNIKQELEREKFSAIHWKTHGVFSSDPIDTFLVAYQESINADELQLLVKTASQEGQKPLELLVLSACETAKGDSRAILGLAGLTVRTGARTALSTLWRANDRATTLLMTNFYQQLQSGKTKAEALHQAQLYLLRQEGYFAPHYWGTYVLVGNWL
jgi:CHAT domain-containing protein